ncbi:hypothetical protein Pcinc_028670 [Petrolisthes cinctipes]|uniref:Nuclear pore complex protein Nup85 n=1 Tax=Petrolisthes cinctipes TaxID=88211 RepID=A0AAE1K8Z6_PETCI|nr:hypothetical protein Pcinc_028670 [Petrolisthes cinctipes]
MDEWDEERWMEGWMNGMRRGGWKDEWMGSGVPRPSVAWQDAWCSTVSSLCNSLVVFPHRHRLHQEGSQLEPGREVHLYQVESFSWLWGWQARKLINESVGTFLSLQKIMQEGGEAEEINTYFGQEMQGIQASMEESIIFEPTEEVESDLHVYGQVLYKMELILSLLEILFIDTKPGGLVLNQLVVWVCSHFPTNHEKKSEALESDHLHQHPSYWEIVYGGVSAAEFTVRWQHWQGECERRLEEGHCHLLQAPDYMQEP